MKTFPMTAREIRDLETGCYGCDRGFPTRPCAITGRPVHRGPDQSYDCRRDMRDRQTGAKP